MRTRPRRRLLVGALLAGSVLCAGATVAFACIGLSTLGASSSSTAAGQQVEVGGEGYAPSDGSVTVHVGTPKGKAVAMVAPQTDGSFHTAFTMPTIGAGRHVLVAVQRDAHGTVTRRASTVIDVAGAGGVVPVSSSTDDLTPVSPSPQRPGLVVVGPLGLTALALLLRAGALVVRRRRRPRPPACPAAPVYV